MNSLDIQIRKILNMHLMEQNTQLAAVPITSQSATVNKSGGKNKWLNFKKLYGNIPYESTTPAIGPGEERLAKILGATIQGPNVSFDLGILDPEGKTIIERWEVKEPDKSGQIRPGTEGLKFANEVSSLISTVVSEMRKFVNAAEETMKSKNQSPNVFLGANAPIYQNVKDFLDSVPSKSSPKSNEELLTSGEITKDAMNGLIKQVINIQSIVKNSQTANHQIEIDGESLQLTPVQILNISRILGRDDQATQQRLGKNADMAIALSVLSNSVFDNPQILMDKWREIRASKVFGNADGVIVVSPEEFTFIPEASLDEKLIFMRISQGRPRFKLNK